MRLRRFKNPDINLGAFDLQLTKSYLSDLACVSCTFTEPLMVKVDCGHTLCPTCFMVEDAEIDYVKSLCGICKKEGIGMKFRVNETFIEKLVCKCPKCSQPMSIELVREHMICCNGQPKFVPNDLRILRNLLGEPIEKLLNDRCELSSDEESIEELEKIENKQFISNMVMSELRRAVQQHIIKELAETDFCDEKSDDEDSVCCPEKKEITTVESKENAE